MEQQHLVQSLLSEFKQLVEIIQFENYIGNDINKKYNELNSKHNCLLKNTEISANIKDYILSQFLYIGDINGHNVPVVRMIYDRMYERYCNYFKVTYKKSDILISDLNHMILTEITPKLFGIPYGVVTQIDAEGIICIKV